MTQMMGLNLTGSMQAVVTSEIGASQLGKGQKNKFTMVHEVQVRFNWRLQVLNHTRHYDNHLIAMDLLHCST